MTCKLLVDKPRSVRPKVLSIVARKLIQKAKYIRGHGLRRLVKQLKSGSEAGGKDAVRDYMSNELNFEELAT